MIKYREMAIKFKEKQKEEAQAPFSKEELALLKNAEAHVDAEIEKQFKHGEISVDLLITSFEYDPTRKQRLALGHVRSRKLQKALEEGIPPTSGIALGVDRLIMLAANEPDIGRTFWLSPYLPSQEPF
jgi:rRNA processing protein Krr1/Pno1